MKFIKLIESKDSFHVVAVFNKGIPIKSENHKSYDDALCAAKFLSVQYRAPIKFISEE